MELLVPIRCRIPELVHKIGKTQRWLAGEVGISKQQMSDYVHMRNILGLVIANRIATILGVSIDELY